MILLINICKEKMHTLEFVEPIKDIIKKLKVDFCEKNYKTVNEGDLKKAKKIIICGTSLKDNEFSNPENKKYFEWIRDFDKPLLGICGGMQIIGQAFKGWIKEEQEIGFFMETFNENFLGLVNQQEVYHLHNKYADFSRLNFFEIFSESTGGIAEAVKHREKPIFGVLFHPEVRNKILIENFCKI
jgi:GMP synthase (glutamine-hydrolysing)